MRVVLDHNMFSRTLFNHSLRQNIMQIDLRAQHTVHCRPLAQLVPYSTVQPHMAPYRHFLLKANKETKVPHTPVPEHNDPHHHICNSAMYSHSTVCNCLHIPSEPSLTTFKSPVNYSSGSALPKLASHK